MKSSSRVAEELWQNHRFLVSGLKYSEADTVTHLIDPVLRYMDYPPAHQIREHQVNKNRPDIVLWNTPSVSRGTSPATAVIEAKPLKHDLEGKGLPRADRPKNQIRRYLNGYEYSGIGTYGILTDGNIWNMVQRSEVEGQTPLIKEWRLLEGSLEEASTCLKEIKSILKESDAPSYGSRQRAGGQIERVICRAISQGKGPGEVLELLTKRKGYSSKIEGHVNLVGKAMDAEADHWADYAFTPAGRVRAEQRDLQQEAVCVAVVKATKAASADDETLYREDTAIAASSFAKVVPIQISVTLMIQPDINGESSAARLAVHYQGHTGMTAEFNPYTPTPMTLRIIRKVHDLIASGSPIMARTLTDTVAAKGVRKAFYDRVAVGWTLRQQRKARGTATHRRAYREAVLRHLIRIIFAWILKEEGKLPSQAFDEAFATRTAPDEYHDGVITFLFHERLNKSEEERTAHSKDEINDALADTPFLNGSLFARHRNDGILRLEDRDYFGTDPNEPGLFTILSEYDWTASEHTSQSSDQTIDPEVISNLFEKLIAATEFAEEVPDRMPAGTYYTPSDIALEMVKDALALAVRDHAPKTWTRDDLLDLFGDEVSPLPVTPRGERNILAARIRNLTVFDPAVGSGEFPYTCHSSNQTRTREARSTRREGQTHTGHSRHADFCPRH